MSDYHEYYYDNSDPQEQSKRIHIRLDDIAELLKLAPEELAEKLADAKADAAAAELEFEDKIQDLQNDIIGMLHEEQCLQIENKMLKGKVTALTAAFKNEKERKKTFTEGFAKQIRGITDKLKEAKIALTGTIPEVLKWRQDNGIDDTEELELLARGSPFEQNR